MLAFGSELASPSTGRDSGDRAGTGGYQWINLKRDYRSQLSAPVGCCRPEPSSASC